MTPTGGSAPWRMHVVGIAPQERVGHARVRFDTVEDADVDALLVPRR